VSVVYVGEEKKMFIYFEDFEGLRDKTSDIYSHKGEAARRSCDSAVVYTKLVCPKKICTHRRQKKSRNVAAVTKFNNSDCISWKIVIKKFIRSLFNSCCVTER